MTSNSPSLEDIRKEISERMPTAIETLKELVRIPSVSWDGFDPERVKETAQNIAARLERTGLFQTVKIVSEPWAVGDGQGQPAVLARREPKPGYPTVMLYAHHDVQPPGETVAWDGEPFEPEIRDGRMYGRGAADDKAGVVVHLTALETLKDTLTDPNIGIVMFIEGEEEYGSKSFPEILSRHRELLQSDIIIVADSDNRSVDIPSLTVSLRGNVAFKLTVSTLEHASHSGMLGGAVPDAMMAAMTIVSRFYKEDGSVAIAGLHSHDAPVPNFESAELAHDSGLLPGVTEIGEGPILSKIWFKPAISVTGIDAPSVQNASNTLIPSVSLKVSVRIAPGQTANDAFEAIKAHIVETAPWGAKVEFGQPDLGNPFLVDTSGSAAALELGALRDAWDGEEPLLAGVGGSIPFVADLVSVFPEAQILITGVEDPESRAHSPNESLSLKVLERAVIAESLFLIRLEKRED